MVRLEVVALLRLGVVVAGVVPGRGHAACGHHDELLRLWRVCRVLWVACVWGRRRVGLREGHGLLAWVWYALHVGVRVVGECHGGRRLHGLGRGGSVGGGLQRGVGVLGYALRRPGGHLAGRLVDDVCCGLGWGLRRGLRGAGAGRGMLGRGLLCGHVLAASRGRGGVWGWRGRVLVYRAGCGVVPRGGVVSRAHVTRLWVRRGLVMRGHVCRHGVGVLRVRVAPRHGRVQMRRHSLSSRLIRH